MIDKWRWWLSIKRRDNTEVVFWNHGTYRVDFIAKLSHLKARGIQKLFVVGFFVVVVVVFWFISTFFSPPFILNAVGWNSNQARSIVPKVCSVIYFVRYMYILCMSWNCHVCCVIMPSVLFMTINIQKYSSVLILSPTSLSPSPSHTRARFLCVIKLKWTVLINCNRTSFWSPCLINVAAQKIQIKIVTLVFNIWRQTDFSTFERELRRVLNVIHLKLYIRTDTALRWNVDQLFMLRDFI